MNFSNWILSKGNLSPKIFKNCLSRFQNWGRGLKRLSPRDFKPLPLVVEPVLREVSHHHAHEHDRRDEHGDRDAEGHPLCPDERVHGDDAGEDEEDEPREYEGVLESDELLARVVRVVVAFEDVFHFV